MVLGKRLGRPATERQYFNIAFTKNGLVSVDAIYSAKDENGSSADNQKPAIFSKVGWQKIETYWGIPADLGMFGATEFKIGIRGKIWAICALWAQISEIPFNPATHAVQVMLNAPANLNKSILAEIERKGRPKMGKRTKPSDWLHLLISGTQSSACPEIDTADALLDCVVEHFVGEQLPNQGEEETGNTGADRLRQIVDEDHCKPSDLLKRLCEIPAVAEKLRDVGPRRIASRSTPDVNAEREIEKLARKSAIHPSIERDLRGPIPGPSRRWCSPTREDAGDIKVRELLNALRGSDLDPKRFIILSGELYVGKKTKINSLLRVIAHNAGDKMLLQLEQSPGEPIKSVPVFARSASGMHYRELVSEVLNFLPEVPADPANLREKASSSDGPTVFGYANTLEGMLENLKRRHKGYPALYIFADVEAFWADRARDAVRDIGIARLIRTIIDSDPDSRVLITMTQTLGPSTGPLSQKTERSSRRASLPDFVEITLNRPKPKEILPYVREDLRTRDLKALLYAADTDIRGDVLLALATLINLREGFPGEHRRIFDKLVRKPRGTRKDERLQIFRCLMDEFSKAKLLHLAALIAASEDGVRDETLFHLMSEWRKYLENPPDLSGIDHLTEALERFKKQTGTKFLLRSRIPRYDHEEYAFDENHSESEQVWEFDAIIAKGLMSAIVQDCPDIAHQAHRLLASAARRRAQIKKVMTRVPIASRASEDTYRDIQCYANLLASIDVKDLGEGNNSVKAKRAMPISLREHEVFSLDPEVFDAKLAVQFALHCLLMEEIDRDFRLSMVTDEDSLRLDLYLRIFQELGEPREELSEALPAPTKLPKHLSPSFFPAEEVLDLMSTVSLAAYHSQRFDVVEKMAELAEPFAVQHNVENYPRKIVRIWCALIDSYILRGGISDENPNHHETLEFVEGLRQVHFIDSEERLLTTEDTVEAIEDETFETAKAGMRLLAREAEICALTNKDRQNAADRYCRIELLEASLACSRKDCGPVILSGRMARRYIRFLFRDKLFRDAFIDDEKGSDANRLKKDRCIRMAEALISVNASRLKRFSGADRVGVLLDTAKLYFAKGDLSSALEYANSAYERAFTGSISPSGKQDVLAVVTDLHLLNAERLAQAGGNSEQIRHHLERGLSAGEELLFLCDRMGYRPYRGIAYYLLAKQHLQHIQLEESTDEKAFNSKDMVDQAYKFIDLAIKEMRDIHDISFMENMEDVQSQVEMRLF